MKYWKPLRAMNENLISCLEGDSRHYNDDRGREIPTLCQTLASTTSLEEFLQLQLGSHEDTGSRIHGILDVLDRICRDSALLSQTELHTNGELQTQLSRAIKACRDHLKAARQILEHARRAIVNGAKSITDIGTHLFVWICHVTRATEMVLRKLLHTPLMRDYSDLIQNVSWLSVDFIYILVRLRRKLISSNTENEYRDHADQCLHVITSLLWTSLYHRNLVLPLLSWKPPIATKEDVFTPIFQYLSILSQRLEAHWIVDPAHREFAPNHQDRELSTILGTLATLASVASDDEYTTEKAKEPSAEEQASGIDGNTLYQFMELVKRQLSQRGYLMWLQCLDGLLHSLRFHAPISELLWQYKIQDYLRQTETHSNNLVKRIHEVLYLDVYSRPNESHPD
eukprot:gb/GECG01002047.1/.p1 GENE.gb/GECG01002047.1/~~gb/GECG01002047.1/.p1  ORF type:complete len:397 (+),score=23.61 gb/GECG01002047.1/:1-1191(+)